MGSAMGSAKEPEATRETRESRAVGVSCIRMSVAAFLATGTRLPRGIKIVSVAIGRLLATGHHKDNTNNACKR